MGGIRCKLLFRLKGFFQPLKQLVKGGGKLGKFVLPQRQPNAAGQVLRLVNRRRCCGNAVQGTKGPPCNPIAAQGSQCHKYRHDNKGYIEQVTYKPVVFGGFHNTPKPHAVFPAHGEPQVQHQVLAVPHIYRAG